LTGELRAAANDSAFWQLETPENPNQHFLTTSNQRRSSCRFGAPMWDRLQQVKLMAFVTPNGSLRSYKFLKRIHWNA